MTYSIGTLPDLPDRCVAQVRTHNRLFGTVIGRCHEQDMRYRARTSGGGVVEFAYTPDFDHPNPIDLGHHVTLTVAPGDVRLEHPDAMEVMSVNTWPARVVLAARRNVGAIVIVKIFGQIATLMSTQRISWLNRAPHAWDRVLVHIPPDAIHVSRRFPGHLRLRPRLLRVTSRSSEAVKRNGDALKELRDWLLDDQPAGRTLRKR